MKNIKLYIGVLATALISLSSCKNDLDVLAPGEESVSVYGILNPNEKVQNIRINKVYLTDGDALTAAQDPSAINYDTAELRVSLQRFLTGGTTPTLTTVGNTTKKEIVLTGTVITTAAGSFNTNQTIWQTTDKLYNSGEYKLTILNKKTGKEFTSQTVVVDSVKSYSQKPFIYNVTLYPGHGNYNFTLYPSQALNLIKYDALNLTQKIKFLSIPNAKLYNVTLRFHYIDTLISGSPSPGYVDFNFPTQKSTTLEGGEPMEVSFIANDFYVNLGTQMSKKTMSNIKNRRSDYLEYIIVAGSETLHTFLQVNQPSNTIAQDKPNYTNINGGVGIFSSSSKSAVTHDMDNAFITKISCHPSTYMYLFCNSSGIPSTSPCP